ncbi:DUF2313 domain-containing protein [Ruminiclostridium herbifermentans]|uniref:DUF2313 domain-containing protein n=1 Tax=Ruminiclostridium herbifermentans TaxID=2488810 RepID=A0A4U7JCP5_9FIRM|nr:putative phage tail protein [Ruminiclostridium herbifermentans]QNU66758.1 DUF2313 domain-containing protein [Ruminiclostridium herbifermentans]
MFKEEIGEVINTSVMFLDKGNFYYLPDFLKEFKEFRRLRKLSEDENAELLKLWNSFENMMDSNFINDSTENGVESWERILNITPKAYDTLNDRKFRILTRLNERLPFRYIDEKRLA